MFMSAPFGFDARGIQSGIGGRIKLEPLPEEKRGYVGEWPPT
jgi:hypothetical protein